VKPKVGLDDVEVRKSFTLAVIGGAIPLPPGQKLLAVHTEPKCMESLKLIRGFTCNRRTEGLLGSFTARHRPCIIIAYRFLLTL
jgi:hypothetical protein